MRARWFRLACALSALAALAAALGASSKWG